MEVEPIPTTAPRRPDTILIVDDEEDILQSLQDLFQVAIDGLQCLTATTGPDGLAVLEQEPVDLIISDFKMPGMSGLEFLRKARGLAPKVPRVLMTAFPDLDVAIQAINETGIETFFTKPLDPEEVIQTVVQLLGERRAEGQRDQAISRAIDTMRKQAKRGDA